MKRYNIINDSLGWLCFVVAAVTYLLTLEPTASFWDCPEFITQGFKLEVGHPPGNPIFMLTARFFVNFAGGDVTKVAVMINAMSGLLSAGTILLLFWTITHLVKRLIVKDDATEVSPIKMLVIFGSGLCGALMYAWSDTFWFSAVEGEVYAFSSFCTALVFWLILKWENRADQPHSDKYIIFIAYIIGISIAVHLLNLLCIPAIVLVVYYKKWKNTTATGSLIALCISFVIVALILYGLVPGFIEISQYFELFCVNSLGMSYNSGVLIYAILMVACFIWTIYNLYRQTSPLIIKISFLLSVLLSGITFIGDNLLIPVVLMIALGFYLFKVKRLPIRILNIVAISILVIFIGYSSYALLLIRSSARTPMNQNAPDNVFALASYLNREQYGDTPLFYGRTVNSMPVYQVDAEGRATAVYTEGRAEYAKVEKTSADEPDRYVCTGYRRDYKMSPELNMIFPRIYSDAGSHPQGYSDWIGGMRGTTVEATIYVDENGDPLEEYKQPMMRPTFGENLQYFMNYQLNHMYWRYFMWNFAGRQNDIQGNGEVNQGNWISGIPFIDNPRLGDQSLLPDEYGKGNAGHNVFFLLPLLMGIIGLGWQAFTSKRGIEQFWVVFFLFFMTGIAIVLYLNQTPAQPRERDYAYAGSFYAYAIWVGMGVAGIWRMIVAATKKSKDESEATDDTECGTAAHKQALIGAVIAAVIGLIVPLQVVSQTWDDHDRSGRYCARDFGMNYLESLDKNAIIFTNGDNDTFPLWYAQEVEGVRTDVKVVNLSYLTTSWYADQIRRPSYDAPSIDTQAKSENYAYDKLQFAYFNATSKEYVPAVDALRDLYKQCAGNDPMKSGYPEIHYPNMFIPIDTTAMIKSGRIKADEADAAQDVIQLGFADNPQFANQHGLYLNSIMALDMLVTSAQNGWNRPIYFAMTVPESYYLGLTPYMQNNGLAYEVTPFYNAGRDVAVNADKMYRNITERFRWGGIDKISAPGQVYLDETVRRMVTTNRSAMLDLALSLFNDAVWIDAQLKDGGASVLTADELKQVEQHRDECYKRSRTILNLMREKLPEAAMPYALQVGHEVANLYLRLGIATKNAEDTKIGLDILHREICRYAKNVVYYQSLSPSQYATLPRNDQYIDHYHLIDLIESYGTGGGDIDAVEKEITALGVNIQRQISFQQALQKAQQQAAQAQAEPAEPASDTAGIN